MTTVTLTSLQESSDRQKKTIRLERKDDALEMARKVLSSGLPPAQTSKLIQNLIEGSWNDRDKIRALRVDNQALYIYIDELEKDCDEVMRENEKLKAMMSEEMEETTQQFLNQLMMEPTYAEEAKKREEEMLQERLQQLRGRGVLRRK